MFYDEEHERYYFEFLEKDNTREGDLERQSLFYLLALNESTRTNIHSIYDFKNHWINIDSINESWQTGSSTKITRFAFNLYNGYKENVDILNIFSSIDRDKFPMLFNAISIRFGG